MKIKRSNVITAMICTIALSISYYSGTVAGKSDADLGEYKSQGKIVFNNGTESGNDDVIFDATDFQKIDDLVTNGKFKIKSELDKYENVSTSDFPTFDEMASAIDAISSGTDAAPKDILSTKKALVNKSIVIGQMPDNSGTEKDAGEITHDDDYTYFSVPEDGYYTVDSKIRGLNSDLGSVTIIPCTLTLWMGTSKTLSFNIYLKNNSIYINSPSNKTTSKVQIGTFGDGTVSQAWVTIN